MGLSGYGRTVGASYTVLLLRSWQQNILER
uniref:Uncharacterized protein n=1 Tax=Arundo donax TaxID=35708 RepID=A0A0A9BI12_ARUDO